MAKRTPKIIKEEINRLESELRFVEDKIESRYLKTFLDNAKGKWFQFNSFSNEECYFKIVDISPINGVENVVMIHSISVEFNRNERRKDSVCVYEYDFRLNGYRTDIFKEVSESYIMEKYNIIINKNNELLMCKFYNSCRKKNQPSLVVD